MRKTNPIISYESGELFNQMKFSIDKDADKDQLTLFIVGFPKGTELSKLSDFNTMERGKGFYKKGYGRGVPWFKSKTSLDEWDYEYIILKPFNESSLFTGGILLSEILDIIIKEYNNIEITLDISSCNRIDTVSWCPESINNIGEVYDDNDRRIGVYGGPSSKDRNRRSLKIRSFGGKQDFSEELERMRKILSTKINILKIAEEIKKMLSWKNKCGGSLRTNIDLIIDISKTKTPVIHAEDMCRILSFNKFMNDGGLVSLMEKKKEIENNLQNDWDIPDWVKNHGEYPGENGIWQDYRYYGTLKKVEEIFQCLLKDGDIPHDAAFGTVLALALE